MTTNILKPQLKVRPVALGHKLYTSVPKLIKHNMTELQAVATEPFTDITTNGTVVPGLFPIILSGVSTKPILDATRVYLGTFGVTQQQQGIFAIDSPVWRQWSNISPFLVRHGVMFEDMNPQQRSAALVLLQTSLSASGFNVARDVAQASAHLQTKRSLSTVPSTPNPCISSKHKGGHMAALIIYQKDIVDQPGLN